MTCLPLLLHLARDGQQGLQFVRNLGGFRIQLDALNQIVVPAQMRRRRSAVGELAKVTLVAIGNVGSNHFTFR